MTTLVLGKGFVSDHLPYSKCLERFSSDTNHIKDILRSYNPSVVVNCIGRTGRPNIDWCEDNKEDVSYTNTSIPIAIASACKDLGIRMIQIGSGCIFFGQSPNARITRNMTSSSYLEYESKVIDPGWKENDFANPKSHYSKTKYACDLAIGGMDHVTTLRIRMPISEVDNQRNLINKLIGYDSVININNSVTFMNDLVRCVQWCIDKKKSGIYHVVNQGAITAADIMKEYKKHVKDHSFKIISESELDLLTKAKRSNCLLNSDKLLQDGFVMSDVKTSIESCMNNYINNLKKE